MFLRTLHYYRVKIEAKSLMKSLSPVIMITIQVIIIIIIIIMSQYETLECCPHYE